MFKFIGLQADFVFLLAEECDDRVAGVAYKFKLVMCLRNLLGRGGAEKFDSTIFHWISNSFVSTTSLCFISFLIN